VGGVTFSNGSTGAAEGEELDLLGAGPSDISSYSFPVLAAEAASGTLDFLITLPAAATALGFDFGAFGSNLVTVTLSDGASQTFTPLGSNYSSTEFVGVTAPGGVTSVEITQAWAADAQGLDLQDFSDVASTPEPASLLLFGTVLAGTVSIVRRRRRTSQHLQPLG
jgi:PEP-CTERM motif